MQGLSSRLAGIASSLFVVFATLSAWGGREVTVSPAWNTEAIQQAIDTCDVVKFAPGDYPLGHQYTEKYYLNAFVITKAVTLMAADPRNKPCLYIVIPEDPAPEDYEVRVFAVHAPLDATVKIQNLKMGAPWNSHIVRCGTFEITGCEPVAPDGTLSRQWESFGLWVASMSTMETGETLTCDIGKFTAVGNHFNMAMPGGQPFYVNPAIYGDGTQHASFVLQNNSFSGTLPAEILQYGSLKMLDNDFTCKGYLYDALAVGLMVGCDALESSAMLDHNRVFLEMPKPQTFDWGFEAPFVQIVTPVSLGWMAPGVAAHNVEIKNTTISSSTEDLILPYVLEAWNAHNCVIKGTAYTGVQVLPSGSPYDFFSEALVALLSGNDVPFNPPIGVQDAAEYMLFYSSDVSLIDNENPQARVLEFPEPGGVRLLGRLQGIHR